MGYSKGFALMMMVVVLGVSMVEQSIAQIPSCASSLAPCADYLNSTKPPASCCNPLRETVSKQRKCLCDLYADKNLLPSFGINVTQALELPRYCGISAGTNLCANAPSPSPLSSTTPPPPGVPGRDTDGASKMAWVGLSSLVLFWASLIAY